MLIFSAPPLPPLSLCAGVKESSIDSLVFDTLIPKPIIQRYLNLLMEHRRIILSGPSGTGKSFLAAKLAEYIIAQMGQEVTEHNVASFNVDQNSSKVTGQPRQNMTFNILEFVHAKIKPHLQPHQSKVHERWPGSASLTLTARLPVLD